MDPLEAPRIPVLGKSPHPPGFSYPVGASAIAEALLGVPQFGRFTLRYSNRTPLFTMPRPWRALPVLRVTYTNYPVYEPRPGSFSRMPQGGERWALEVLPTPAEQRLEFQQVILDKALPDFREWLNGPELPPPDARRAIRACWFVIDTGVVKWVSEDPSPEPE
jgi:hypothetical protein